MKQKANSQKNVMSKIRAYAVRQLCSWETLETLVMIGLIIYMLVLFRRISINIYSGIVFAAFAALAAFGLYETIPALIMFFTPYESGAFGMKADRAEKMRICDEIDKTVLPSERVELHDATFTKKYLVLEGERNIEVLRWEDITEVRKVEYPFRQKYKGRIFLHLIDRDKKKHELDIHNGKYYNPVRQTNTILLYIREHHPEIRLDLSETDEEQIAQFIEENRKIHK